MGQRQSTSAAYAAMTNAVATWEEVHRRYEAKELTCYKATGTTTEEALEALLQKCVAQDIPRPERVRGRYYCGRVNVRNGVGRIVSKRNPVFFYCKRGLWVAKTFYP